MRIYFSDSKFVTITSYDKTTTKINGDTVEALEFIVPNVTAEVVREQFSDTDSLDVIEVRDDHDIFVEKLIGYQKVKSIAFDGTKTDRFVVTVARGNETLEKVSVLEKEFKDVKLQLAEALSAMGDAVREITAVGDTINKAVNDAATASSTSSANAVELGKINKLLNDLGDSLGRTNQSISATDEYIKGVKKETTKVSDDYAAAMAAVQDVLNNVRAIVQAGDELKTEYIQVIEEIRGYINIAKDTKDIAAENDHSMKIAIEKVNETTGKIEDYDKAIEDHGKQIAAAADDVKKAANDVIGYQKTIDEIDERVAKLEPVKDITALPLEEAKAVRIAESKQALAEYLETHPITSRCHGGVEAQYSITAEKQSYLQSMILMTTQAVTAGMEYQPSWNSVGNPCSYDWTLEELQQLAIEIEGVVRPLVSMQQGFEVQINAAETMDALTKVDIHYVSKELEV